jgi:hypothetical protein
MNLCITKTNRRAQTLGTLSVIRVHACVAFHIYIEVPFYKVLPVTLIQYKECHLEASIGSPYRMDAVGKIFNI